TAYLRSKPHIVLGYNGCDRDAGEEALSSNSADGLIASKNGYDWLGSGIYFWEADPMRALDWARETHLRHLEREKTKGVPVTLRRPYVVGAVINLGTCLDLTTIEGVALVREGYAAYISDMKELQRQNPAFKIPKNTPEVDPRFRWLDYAVINYTCRVYEAQHDQPIDTVRSLFLEGDPIYDGATFREKDHTQICVRKPSN